MSPSPDTASKRAKGIYETSKKCRVEKTGEISRNLPFSRFSSSGSKLTCHHVLYILFGSASCGKFFIGRILTPDLFKNFQSTLWLSFLIIGRRGCPVFAVLLCASGKCENHNGSKCNCNDLLHSTVSFQFRLCFRNSIGNPININNFIVYLRGRLISNTAPPSFAACIVPL